MVHARVQYIGRPATAVLWVWGAHERVSVNEQAERKRHPEGQGKWNNALH